MYENFFKIKRGGYPMKILKYMVFILILIGIFFVIYRQSDENGFRRWQISFKIAVLIAASTAGLIPLNLI